MTDETDQSDELLALKSIYESMTCDMTETPLRGSIDIELLEIPRHTTVDMTSNGETFSFHSLPPLVLDFSFPSDYPSSNPPYVGLRCLWLTPEELEMLSDKLVQMWNEGANCVIMFTWLNFLQYEALEFLRVEFPRSLDQDLVHEIDQFVCAKEKAAFSKKTHTCPMCSCETPGHECKMMTNCEHFFCKSCLTNFLRVRIPGGEEEEPEEYEEEKEEDEEENRIRCPVKECPSEMAVRDVVEVFVTEEELIDYDKELLRHSIGETYDIHFCPRPTCKKPAVAERKMTFGVCNVCQFAFCLRCRLAYHGVDECRDLKKAVTTYKENAPRVFCPSCWTKNEQIPGTSKIVCKGCDKHFCASCSKVLLKKFSDNHFSFGFPECVAKKVEEEEKKPTKQKKQKKPKSSNK